MAFRIGILYFLTVLGLLLALGGGVYFSAERALLDARRQDLQASANSVAGLLEIAASTQSSLIILAPTLARTIATPNGSTRSLRVFSSNGALLVAVPDQQDPHTARRPSTVATQLLPPSLLTLAITPVDAPGMIYAAQPIVATSANNTQQTIGVVEVMQPSADIDELLERMRNAFGIAGGAALALALLIGWLLARSVTAPVRRLQQVAADIAGGDLQRRASNLPHNEIGALGDSFNVMSARLADLLAGSQSEQQRLLAILSSLADGVLACDDQGRLTLHNPAAVEMLGLGARPNDDAISESIAASGIDTLWRRAMGHEPNNSIPAPVEQELQVAGRAILAIATPVYGGAQPTNTSQTLTPAPLSATPLVLGCVSVLRDMTRMRELEQARSTLLRRLSHELRTPLTALVATVDNMRDTASPDQEAAMTTVESEALRLSRLVDELLSISRGASSQLNDARPVDLVGLATTVVALFKQRAERLGIELTASTSGQAVVRGDPDRLRQVLVNLLDNALRYVEPGGRVTVSVQRQNGEATLAVADNGPGMDPQTAQHAFEPYQQGPATAATSETATRNSGLGLTIVREITQAHGGRVSLDTAPGQGTTVIVRLPATSRQ